MNRRELLQRLAGVPLLGVLVPVVAKAATVVVESARPVSYETEATFIRRYEHVQYAHTFVVTEESSIDENEAVDLSEDSLEQLCGQITAEAERIGKPVTVRPTHVHVRLHELSPYNEYCVHCGASAQQIEDWIEPLYCWRNRG